MCGISGYIGNRNAVAVVVDMLKRLEYRGYDSAGIAYIKNQEMIVHKDKGKIENLTKNIYKHIQCDSKIAIGHTRWATHGEPSEKNAHPHTDCKNEIALVHNGIIENNTRLKTLLESEGHVFKSDTDTEVIVHLIEKFYNGENLEDAVIQAIHLLSGSYGIAVISKKEEKIVAAKLGSPLIIGLGKNEYFVSSDIPALLPYTRDTITLEDGEIAVITKTDIKIKDANSVPVKKEIEKILWDVKAAEKNGFAHFMLKEIYEQPKVMKDTMRGRLLSENGIARLGGLNLTNDEIRKIKKIIFIACGTSLHAGIVGKYVLGELAGIDVKAEHASEFQYMSPAIDENTIVIAISQSGETPDTISSMREAKERGAKVLGICNVVGSTIARETDGGTYTYAGPEIGVASTKAFTAQMTVIYLMALYFGRIKNTISPKRVKELVDEMEKIPEKIEKIMEESKDKIQECANKFYDKSNFLYLGRGYNFPIALEGALKLKEISYIHAEGYPAGEIAMIDENTPCVVIAVKDGAYEKVISNIEQIKARKGKVIAIATEGDTEITKKADYVIYVPETDKMLYPFMTVIPLQMLAYYIGIKKGCDVDKPRNLAKSVTVE